MEAYRFENQAKAFDKSMKKRGKYKSYILRKGLLESKDFLSKNMIGDTRDESSIRLQKQVHVKRESHELEEEDGAYVSKQVRCIAYHLTSQA